MRRSSSNECWKEVKTEKERSGNDAKRKEGSGHVIECGMTQRNVTTKCFDLLWDIWCIIINSRHSKFGWLVPASPCIALLSWIFESDDNRVCVFEVKVLQRFLNAIIWHKHQYTCKMHCEWKYRARTDATIPVQRAPLLYLCVSALYNVLTCSRLCYCIYITHPFLLVYGRPPEAILSVFLL